MKNESVVFPKAKKNTKYNNIKTDLKKRVNIRYIDSKFMPQNGLPPSILASIEGAPIHNDIKLFYKKLRESEYFYIDGTFVYPKGFKQLITILYYDNKSGRRYPWIIYFNQ